MAILAGSNALRTAPGVLAGSGGAAVAPGAVTAAPGTITATDVNKAIREALNVRGELPLDLDSTVIPVILIADVSGAAAIPQKVELLDSNGDPITDSNPLPVTSSTTPGNRFRTIKYIATETYQIGQTYKEINFTPPIPQNAQAYRLTGVRFDTADSRTAPLSVSRVDSLSIIAKTDIGIANLGGAAAFPSGTPAGSAFAAFTEDVNDQGVVTGQTVQWFLETEWITNPPPGLWTAHFRFSVSGRGSPSPTDFPMTFYFEAQIGV